MPMDRRTTVTTTTILCDFYYSFYQLSCGGVDADIDVDVDDSVATTESRSTRTGDSSSMR